MAAVRPSLPWEEPDTPQEGGSSVFENSHDLMIAVLNHEMFRFNEIVLKRIATDSVVRWGAWGDVECSQWCDRRMKCPWRTFSSRWTSRTKASSFAL